MSGNSPKNGPQNGKPNRRTKGSKPLRSHGMKQRNTPDSPKRAYGQRSHGAPSQPRRPRGGKDRGRSKSSGQGWIWGWHAVQAVLNNPRRTVHEVIATEAAAQRLGLSARRSDVKILPPPALDKILPNGAAHQGLAVKAAPLEWPDLAALAADADDDALFLVLDQITDPHNVGAMLRLASAFGARALVMQSRKAPPLFGATAKVAVGCIETVPVCLETNIAQSLKTLHDHGFTSVGLAGDTQTVLADALREPGRYALVMGAEGPGLRDLVAKTCDHLARIPMMSSDIAGEAESLNVATAAAIALYEARR